MEAVPSSNVTQCGCHRGDIGVGWADHGDSSAGVFDHQEANDVRASGSRLLVALIVIYVVHNAGSSSPR